MNLSRSKKSKKSKSPTLNTSSYRQEPRIADVKAQKAQKKSDKER